MRVLIVIGATYPHGSAAAKRVQQMARGLQEAGAEPLILGLLPRGWEDDGEMWKKDEYGIPYTLVARPPGVSGFVTLVSKAPRETRSILARLQKVVETERIDAFIIYNQLFHLFWRSWRILRWVLDYCRSNSRLCLTDSTEWHSFSVYKMLIGTLMDQWLFIHRLLPSLSGVIGISTLWCDLAESRGVPSILLPAFSTAGNEAGVLPAAPTAEPPKRPFTLTYLGQLSARDMPMTML
ncbi:MAG: glycosyltransferase, partial [Planctomycetes bacterium]|nr:glycosyltransferase [Planctomycetota bacterium]